MTQSAAVSPGICVKSPAFREPSRPRGRGLKAATKRTARARKAPSYIQSESAREALERLHAKAPPDWQAIDRGYRIDWLRQRLREFVNVHGYASSGVCALLEQAAAAYADAAYMRALTMAAVTASPNREEIGALKFAQSCTLAAKALEVAAWEIAVREGKSKRELDALEQSSRGSLSKALAEGSRDADGEDALDAEWPTGGLGAQLEAASPLDPPGGDQVPGPLSQTDSAPPKPAPPKAAREPRIIRPTDAKPIPPLPEGMHRGAGKTYGFPVLDRAKQKPRASE